MKPIGLCSLCFLLAAVPASGVDCENWNTKEFFETATPKAVTDCLHAGADPNARTQDGNSPGDYAEQNQALKDTDAYRHLQDGS